MTTRKHLKARIRARMATTGERYLTARRHVVTDPPRDRRVDHGYALRGGVHPDSAALANVLAHHGIDLSEAMMLGIGGGLGAGYILWEFEAHRGSDARCWIAATNAGARGLLGERHGPPGPRAGRAKLLEAAGRDRAAATLTSSLALGRHGHLSARRGQRSSRSGTATREPDARPSYVSRRRHARGDASSTRSSASSNDPSRR